jgi:hypothetical protein
MGVTGEYIQIITGRYGKGTAADNEIVEGIFGKESARERFELYFHWYNIIHELGHGIIAFNSPSRLHPAQEEQLVNDFAVSYWSHYGEKEKLTALSVTVAYALTHLNRPVDHSVTHLEYAYDKWGKEELYNFNNYGWFQFSCVEASLRDIKPLDAVLSQMGVRQATPQPLTILTYDLNEDMAARIVEEAADTLRQWGATIPHTSVTLDDDPNRHMCKTSNYTGESQ